MQVAPGIHKVDGVRISNVYVVEADAGLLVVDTGIRGNARHVLRCVEALGRRPGDVRWIVLTHWHIDHVGSAAELRRRTGAQVAMHELDAPVLEGKVTPPKGRRAMAVINRLFRLERLSPDVRLREGDVVGGLEVLHVPGHTDGSIALRWRDGALFSGDALLGDRHGGIQPPDKGLSLDPETALRSAERLRGLDFTLLLPGHGRPAERARG